MKKLTIILIGLIGFSWGCTEQYIDDIEMVEPGQDTEAPEVIVNYPVEGTQIRVTEDVTSIDIDFEVQDDIEIQTIVLELNGNEIARFDDFKDYRRVFEVFEFDNVTNGEHTLEITATDMAGKSSTTAVDFEKIEPYRPIYDGEIFYVPFDGDYMELVNIQTPNIIGSPGFADGLVGRAFNGASNAYLTYNAEHLSNEAFSAVFWYNVNASPDRAGLLVMGPPDEANPTAMNDRTKGFRLFRESAGTMQRIKLNVGNGTGENWFDGGASADIDPSEGAWSHIAFTISGTRCAVYINGEVVSEGEFPGIDWTGCDLLSVGSGAPRFAGCQNEKENSDSIKALGYARHVELQWNAEPGAAAYQIMVGMDGEEFIHRITVEDTMYLDFVHDLGTDQTLNYKIEAVQGTSTHSLGEVKVKTQEMTHEELLDMVQYYTFRYFWEGAEPHSGMARERIHLDGDYPQNDQNVVTTGGTGFGIYGILAGIERNWISKEEGLARFEKMVVFLENADRFHGIWSHWIFGETGKVKPFGRDDDGADLVESAFLMQGLLAVREYYKGGGEREQALAEKIDQMWKEMEWDWHTQGGQDVLYWHWSPNFEWQKNFGIRGYDECMITYILAASSPTHTVPASVFHNGWAREGEIKNDIAPYGHELTLRHNGSPNYGGPLFWAHYSYIGLNPKGLVDEYADYWAHNRNHTLINREWCIQNEQDFKGYGQDLWGLTASYSTKGYSAHKPDNDLGVISPTAALSSIPYTPEASMDVIKNLYYNYGEKVFGKYGFYDAMSPEENWYPQRYLAIDQGPIVAMIENHRTGLGWDLFMGAPEIQEGLKKLGFSSQP